MMRLLCLLLVTGCGLGHRLARFPPPARYVTEPPGGHLVEVSLTSEGGVRRWEAEVSDGGLVRPMRLGEEETIAITPLGEPVTLAVRVRSGAPAGRDFETIYSVTGAREGELVDEVRFLPPTLSERYALPVRDLTNVYNGYRFRDGDLLAIEVSSATGEELEVDRYLFLRRALGWRLGGAFDVLVRSPLVGEERMLSPAITGGLVASYRVAAADSLAARVLDPLGVQLSLGIGSSALEQARTAEDLTDGVDQAFYAALGGGGVRLWDVLSVQVLVNLSALARPEIDPIPALAVGVDAATLAVLTRDVATKLLRPSPLSEPESTSSKR